MRKLNVAILGCGFWGKNHARVLSELESSNLVAVADIKEERARTIGEKYHVKWYTDPMKIMERKDIEFVSICTPTITHAQLALETIKAGKHVLVEKPMTNTVEEAKEVIEKADKEGVHVMVGFIERFNPAVRKAEELIEKGEIGDIVLASSKRVSRWPERIGDVGVIKDLAIHDIDLIRFLFQDNVKQVYAVVGSLAHKYEDYANIVLRFKNGKSAFIEANWLTPRKIRRLIVTGTEGILQVEYINQEVLVENDKMAYQPFFTYDEPLKLELDYFVSSLLRGEKPTPSGEDGLMALTICEAALKSGKTSSPIDLSLS
ncbi:Gfo/Idh/MocA family oxidoreductase [Candidatus Bathyarchaeota archaeon]|nr:Gfo/Idh/MocA family oxidoreductase [Candidatus Bathyarchaeota archaeon]